MPLVGVSCADDPERRALPGQGVCLSDSLRTCVDNLSTHDPTSDGIMLRLVGVSMPPVWTYKTVDTKIYAQNFWDTDAHSRLSLSPYHASAVISPLPC